MEILSTPNGMENGARFGFNNFHHAGFGGGSDGARSGGTGMN